MSGRSVSILIPAFNEAGNIAAAIDGALWAAHQARLDWYEVIVVDDGSTDGTGDMATSLYDAHVRVLRHDRNLGLAAAYETGLAAAQGAYVAWTPGDAEMTPKSLLKILAAIGEADLVVPFHGTPARRPWVRRLLTWVSTTQLNVLLGHRLDYYQGPTVYPVEMARALPRTERGFFFAAEMLAWALEGGASYVSVPLTHTERAYGVSKAVSWRRIVAAQLLILKLAARIWRARLGTRVPSWVAS